MKHPEQNGTTDATANATQLRFQQQGAVAGSDGCPTLPAGKESSEAGTKEHREEVAGKGSGPFSPKTEAGGSPVINNTSGSPILSDDALALDPAQLSREGDPSNTPSQKTTLGGEDWLTVNFYVNYLDFTATTKRLDKAQAAAIAGETDDDEIQIGDVRCVVSPGGAKQGKGPNAQHMRWRIQSEQGLTFLLMNRGQAHLTQPNITVHARSLLLMRLGFDAVWDLMRYVVEQLGCEIVKNKISRVDACIDLPEIPVDMFSDLIDLDWFVSRAKHRGKYAVGETVGQYSTGKRSTGFTVGKNPLVLRVYDKLEEVRRDPLKKAVLVAHRWNGTPRATTRIEIQLGRGKLKKYGVDTVEDWRSKRSDILSHLLHDWFRLTDGPVDRNHANRVKTYPLWAAIRKRFAECYGPPTGYDLSPLPNLRIDTSQRVAMAVGVFKGLFACSGRSFRDNEQFIYQIEIEIRNCIRKRNMAKEIQRKSIEIGIEVL